MDDTVTIALLIALGILLFVLRVVLFRSKRQRREKENG
jgi:hypothetical protein